MKKVSILLQGHEITLRLPDAPEILTDRRGRLKGIRTNEAGVDRFIRFCDWGRVEAIIQYDEDEKEGEPDGAQEG